MTANQTTAPVVTALAIGTAGLTIACAVALGSTARPVELAWALVSLGAAALLYLRLRRG